MLVLVNDEFLLEDDLPGLLPIGQVIFKCYLLINKSNILVADYWTELFGGRNASLYKAPHSLRTADAFPVVASLPPKNSVCEPDRQNDFLLF